MTRIGLLFALWLSFGAHAYSLALDDVLVTVPELDPGIPRPEAVVGVQVAERHWYHHEIVRYLDALAAASPRVVALGEHARSYGGRPLVSYAISSARNLERLDAIRAARAALIDPDATPDLSAQPAVVHMMYSIHGNEPSGSNATPLVAYYLAAAQDPSLAQQLDRVVVLLTPMQNPDGLDRFAMWSNRHRGRNPSPDPEDREHRETVPNGRTNYYGFDLNRDWLAHQHPESRGRLALFHRWKPNVQLDVHEQGSDASFFFMPGKPERTHPLTPSINQQLTRKIGEFHARAFDRAGTRYFTEERYDDFFMGKGSTYPDLFGCVGILVEQPSSRGALQETRNGLLTFADTIANQFRASLSTLEGTAALRDELLAYQRGFYANRERTRGYYLAAAPGDPTRLREFVRILDGHGIVSEVLAEDVTVDGHRYPAATSIAIPLDQPQSTYLRALWNRQTEFEENVFYDVSTWTLPWAFNLTHTREPVQRVATQALPGDFLRQSRDLPGSAIGYLIDWRDTAVPALLYDLLDAEANVRVARRPFVADTVGRGPLEFGYGSLLVAPELDAPLPDAATELLRAAAANGAPVYAVASSYTRSGIDIGSRDWEVLALPKVMVVTGPGSSAYSTAELWHLLDRRVDMPLTMVDSDRLPRVDLGDYTHIVLNNPLKSLSGKAIEKLRIFVASGGVLWAQGAATVKWLQEVGLSDVMWRRTDEQKQRDELERKRGDDKEKDNIEVLEALLPERRRFADAVDERAFERVRGAILAGDIDTTHPLGYGYTEAFLPVFRRSEQFMARAKNAYATPLLYADDALVSGYMSAENRALAGGSAGLVVDQNGEGAIVLSLDSVAFRAFWWGTQRLLINALFFGDLLEEPR